MWREEVPRLVLEDRHPAFKTIRVLLRIIYADCYIFC